MIIFDLETTGLPKAEGSDLEMQPKIIEFGGIKVDDDFNKIDSFEFFCNPGHPLDPKIINIQINFTAVVDYSQDKVEALNAAITEIQEMFEQKLDISQPIYITKIYDRLNNLEEIVDVTNVKITNKASALYSDETISIDDYMSADGRILYAPENVIYELKFPNVDIKGTIR